MRTNRVISGIRVGAFEAALRARGLNNALFYPILFLRATRLQKYAAERWKREKLVGREEDSLAIALGGDQKRD